MCGVASLIIRHEVVLHHGVFDVWQCCVIKC